MNIFENAYFGKAYKTRDGRKAILLDKTFDSLIINFGIINKVGSFIQYAVNNTSGILVQNGREFKDYPCELDIVSEWQEEINKEELEKLAMIEGAKAISHFVNREQSKFAFEWADLVKEAYKAGYRKAKQEQLKV